MRGNTVGSRFNTQTNEFWAYLAGFLDGDGCITAIVERSKTNRSGVRVRIRVSFTQHRYRRKVLDKLKAEIGEGQVAEYNHNSMAEYVIRDQKIILEILEKIKPYLIAKAKHLELALKLMRLENWNSNKTNLQKAMKLAQDIKGLNKYPKRVRFDPVTTEVERPRYRFYKY
ncbi:hypothetical protein A2V71_02370 [Candidatus Berkelbacteria bacterium RBG_13_40_8]|uniref:Homing endonuclease LAGLIDADG domain-containing protein n=1 Tax=Candidatus Berkelbacteria bacterium RBG_13_40_8 TaxID=1797467 RepID=A0A1F5DN16_9BACT|nr:MAG: hypothetical protein A2V71_02370 [Candidatus Berkelbacteria bacterium RBG_13_40_8]